MNDEQGARGKRSSSRLGIGTYDWPDRRAARDEARVLFLLAVKQIEPRVLLDLAQEPLTRYNTSGLASSPNASVEIEQLIARGLALELGEPDVLAFRESLLAWGTHYHLTDPWLLAIGVATLSLWCRFPQLTGQEWDFGGYGAMEPFDDDDLTFRFVRRIGTPTFHTVEESLRALRDEFEGELVAFRDRLRDRALAVGMEETREKRNREHFAWLARYQLGESLHVIAGDCGVPNVHKAVKEAKELVALTLRPPYPGGRPKGAKDRLPRATRAR